MSCRSSRWPPCVEGERMRAVIAFFIGIVTLAATHAVSAQSASARATADKIDPAAAIRAANNRFAGVWKLVGEETRDARGEVVPGPNARSGGRIGYIVYDPAGYVS